MATSIQSTTGASAPPNTLNMLIPCPHCAASVDARVIGHHESGDLDFYDAPFRTSLVECPICSKALVGGSEATGVDQWDNYEWGKALRLYPAAESEVSRHIPKIVGTSLEEADLCFRARAYSACAVMCGRALEGMCRHFGTQSRYLGGGLKELLDRNIIDARLFSWSEVLQQHRNLGAHASEECLGREDARDLLDFVHAITEYVFVLSERCRLFMERKEKTARQAAI